MNALIAKFWALLDRIGLGFMREADKQGHFWAGGMLGALLQPHTGHFFAVLIVFVVAAFKEEVVDRKTGGEVSIKDAIATVIGGGVGSLLSLIFSFA